MDGLAIRSDQKGQDRVAARVRLSACTAAGLSMALIGSACGDGPPPPRDDFTVDAEFEPEWATPPTPDPVPESAGDSAGKAIVIYVDLSTPMAGFLPMDVSHQPGDGTVTNHFRAVSQWVPDHLTRVYPGATLDWRGVGRGIRNLGEYPRFERSLFDATATRLDLAIQEAISDLRTGRSEAVAVVTDLLGTGELTGALAVSRYLVPWLESEAVRSGEHHLGLLGVKANYWGGIAPSCPPQDGLGCWFSERGGGWRRLNEVGQTPFYVLLMGRNPESVSTIIESIQRDAGTVEIEAVSELLTKKTLRRTVGMMCGMRTPDGQQQYALRREEGGHYSCVRNDPFLISCGFDGGFATDDVTVGESGGGFEARVVPGNGGFEIAVDCGSLRNQEPSPDLLLDITGGFGTDSDMPPWDEWSIETDDVAGFPGRTLQLRYFIEEVRLIPARYRARRLPVLLGGKR